MNSSKSRPGCLLIFLIAVGLTLASVLFIRVDECPPPYNPGCQARAGFPLAVIWDQTGGSPLSGIGRLDSSDFPSPITFVLDVLFYGAFIQHIWSSTQVIRGKEKPLTLLWMLPLFALVLLFLIGPPLARAAEVREWQRENQLQAAILGDWTATEASSDTPFTLRLEQFGAVFILLADFPYGNQGNYSWDGSTLSMTFQWASPAPEGDVGPCTDVPSFLKGVCHYSVVEPASYPVSAESNPTFPPMAYPEPAAGPYPAPEPPNTTFIRSLRSELRETFIVDMQGDTMTLTHPSGTSQTFQRETGQ